MDGSDQAVPDIAYSPMPDEAGSRDFIARCDRLYPPDAVAADIAQQRKWYGALCDAFAYPHPPGLLSRDDHIAGVAVRMYYPAKISTTRKLLYLHGGGFIVGSLDSHDAICAEMAEAAGAEMISVDYRLAPEHLWPAAHQDAFGVARDVLSRGAEIVLIGDSAGATLAGGLAIRARDEGLGAGVIGQVLIYPALGGDLGWPSYGQMASAPGLSTDDVIYYRDVLKAPMDDPVAYPLSAEDLRG